MRFFSKFRLDRRSRERGNSNRRFTTTRVGLSRSRTPRIEPLERRAMLSVSYLPGLEGPADLPIQTTGQVIYLDFDGEQGVDYDGPIAVEDIDIPAFSAVGVGLAGQEAELGRMIAQGVIESLSPLGVQIVRASCRERV